MPEPIASFDFDHAPEAGAFASASGDAVATVHGVADLVAGRTGHGRAAQLGESFWLSLTKRDGSSLLKGAKAVTISYNSKAADPNGQGWSIFAAPTDTAVDGASPTYLGIMDQIARVRVERFANGRDDDHAAISEQNRTGWKHVDVVIDGTSAKLYVDHKYAAHQDAGNTLASTIGAGGVFQIGKGNWGTGEYFRGQLDDLRIYDRALTPEQLGVPAPKSMTISGDGIAARALSLKQGSTQTLAVSMQPEGAIPGSSWASSDSSVVSVDSDGTIHALKPGTAMITASATANPAVHDSVRVTVTDVKPTEQYGYLMVHFLENSAGYSEKIFLDISRGDNPEQWDPLNGGEPILTNNRSTTGVRDPYIAYDPQTKTYYILATDLRVFGGDNRGWGPWTHSYSTKLSVWESKDLIHFQPLRTFDTSADTTGKHQTNLTDAVTGKTIEDLGMAWAPEATWVPNFFDLNDDGQANGSAKGGAFVVYWAANPSIDGDRHNRVMWGSTTDFTQKTFRFGGVYVDTGGNTIDTTMLQKSIGAQADGNPRMRSYRISKDNGRGQGIFMQTTDQPAWWRASDWRTTQTSIGSPAWAAHPGGVEGPAGFVDHSTHRWFLYVDRIPSAGYAPMVSTDLDASTPWTALKNAGFYMAPHTKHGGIISLTKAQYDAIRQSDALRSDNENLTAGTVSVKRGAAADAVRTALPANQRVKLAYGYGSATHPIKWDFSSVDTSKVGTYTVTGTVQGTMGANLNHWKWTDAQGTVHDDVEGVDQTSNSQKNADNIWKRSGGFDAADDARVLYSSTAIPVIARVKVEDASAVNPINPADPTNRSTPARHSRQPEIAKAAIGAADKMSLARTGASLAVALASATVLLVAGAVMLWRRRRWAAERS